MVKTPIESIRCPACNFGLNIPLKFDTSRAGAGRPGVVDEELTAPPFVTCKCGARIHLSLSNFISGDHFLTVTSFEPPANPRPLPPRGDERESEILMIGGLGGGTTVPERGQVITVTKFDGQLAHTQ